MQEYLSPKQVAERYKHLSETMLQRLRIVGGGPPFIKAGHKTILYRPEAIDKWLLSREVNSNAQASML